MIRIVRTRTLGAVHAEAAQVPDLRRQVAELSDQAATAGMLANDARAQAETAREDAWRAREAYEAIENTTLVLSRLRLAAQDPVTGESMRGAIALVIIRDEIARVRAEGSPEDIRNIRVVEAILGDHAGDELAYRPDTAEVSHEAQ